MAIEALQKKLDQIKVNVQSIFDKILHAPIFLFQILANNKALEKKFGSN